MFMLNPYIRFKCVKAQLQKDLNIIFAYIRPSLRQGYSQYTCSVVLNDLRVIPLYPTVFMLLMAEALVIVALPFEKLLIVENTVEFPIERRVALKAKTKQNSFLACLFLMICCL